MLALRKTNKLNQLPFASAKQQYIKVRCRQRHKPRQRSTHTVRLRSVFWMKQHPEKNVRRQDSKGHVDLLRENHQSTSHKQKQLVRHVRAGGHRERHRLPPRCLRGLHGCILSQIKLKIASNHDPVSLYRQYRPGYDWLQMFCPGRGLASRVLADTSTALYRSV